MTVSGANGGDGLRRRKQVLAASFAAFGMGGVVAWLVIGLASGDLLPIGGIALYVGGISFALLVLVLSANGDLPGGGPLDKSRRRTLLWGCAVTAVIGISAIVLRLTDSPTADGIFALGAATGASLSVLDAIYAIGPPDGYRRASG